jgi:sacsin
VRRFLVSQARGRGEAAALARELSGLFQTHLTPWAAIAAELGVPGAAAEQTGKEGGGAPLSACAGRAFCFLPLPVSTGLPVAVNGYFELSSNRRDVWHGGDMAGAGAARARWNEALLRLVAAPAYAALLAAAARKLGPGAQYGALWPSAAVPAPWQLVVEELYRLAARRPLIWSRAAGAARWIAPADCVFFPAGQQEDDGLAEGLLGLGVALPDLPTAVAATMQAYMVRGFVGGGGHGRSGLQRWWYVEARQAAQECA